MVESSYTQQYKSYGLLPKANKKELAKFTPIKQPLQDLTSYKLTHNNVQGEVYQGQLKLNRDEKQRVREYQLKQVSGSLTNKNLKFVTGNSAAKETYVRPTSVVRPSKILPFNMLMVPRQIKMQVKTTS